MYWNNPLIEVKQPISCDPVAESLHKGVHCLFWNPSAKLDHVVTQQKLADLCEWANNWLRTDGIDAFAADTQNHYDLANLVKLNMWIHSIREHGIVKPWLFLDQGDGTYLAGNGDSRLRCLERIPEIKTVAGFVSTTANRKHLYEGLEQVTTFERFAELCGANHTHTFLFRLTDNEAPYGMYWYEFNSERTRSVTPSEPEAVQMFVNYYKQNPNIVITPAWFDQVIAWQT